MKKLKNNYTPIPNATIESKTFQSFKMTDSIIPTYPVFAITASVNKLRVSKTSDFPKKSSPNKPNPPRLRKMLRTDINKENSVEITAVEAIRSTDCFIIRKEPNEIETDSK